MINSRKLWFSEFTLLIKVLVHFTNVKFLFSFEGYPSIVYSMFVHPSLSLSLSLHHSPFYSLFVIKHFLWLDQIMLARLNGCEVWGEGGKTVVSIGVVLYFIFQSALHRFQSACSFLAMFQSADSFILSHTQCSIVSNTCIYKQNTPLYETEQNAIETMQWRLLKL